MFKLKSKPTLEEARNVVRIAAEDAAERLRDAEMAYRAASERAEAARNERNRLLAEALEAGWTHAQIAKVMDLTRSRVGQLAQTIRHLA